MMTTMMFYAADATLALAIVVWLYTLVTLATG
jgi:hypothetical protein